MRVTLESTSLFVELNGVPARVWEGTTEAGVPVHAFITRIAVDHEEDCSEFDRDLRECQPPSPEVASYPTRLIL